jgi:ribulose-5-phosphate 4-epimerase/fuculose-1-phosphate aldolase
LSFYLRKITKIIREKAKGCKSMNILLVGGNYDKEGGKPSGLITKMYQEIIKHDKAEKVDLYNGGHFDVLESYIEKTVDYDVVMWFPNVGNEEAKYRNVKQFNPRCIFITSKVNNKRYNFMELVKHALDLKANLTVEFNTNEKPYQMMVFDPLANYYYNGTDIKKMIKVLMDRTYFLSNITRQGTIQGKELFDVPNEEKFFEYIKNTAEVFHELINPAPTTRFLGNSSFRCSKGFPSFRHKDLVYMSRRNIDKRYIGAEGFVPVKMENDGHIIYYADFKPSVDTPIQIRLYQALPNINYMLHAHVYAETANYTVNNIPCGGIEEVQEILSVIENRYTNFEAINLIGHGCIIMSDDIEKLKSVKFKKREVPEKL